MERYAFNGLANVNVELTNRCNKQCWMCGRRKVEAESPELALKYGDMNFELVQKIARQLPPDIVVQLHNNGEGLMYPHFGKAVDLFDRQITNLVSNGKLLVEKADEIIGKLDTLAISIIEADPEADEQYEILKEFLAIKGDRKPFTNVRLNGEVDSKRYENLVDLKIKRTLHSPMGSFNYKKDPTIPEIGICLDFLNHIAINREGKVSICVRFDPKGLGVIGDANTDSLESIWNSPKRREWLNLHIQGRRKDIPLCSYCQFWGVPTAGVSEKNNLVLDENIVINNDTK